MAMHRAIEFVSIGFSCALSGPELRVQERYRGVPSRRMNRLAGSLHSNRLITLETIN